MTTPKPKVQARADEPILSEQTWIHVRTGNEYVVVDVVHIKDSAVSPHWNLGVSYRRKNPDAATASMVWVRPQREFRAKFRNVV